MTISDTSALVLHWTSKEIWKSKNAQNYFSHLDLSNADPLVRLYTESEYLMSRHILSNRKFFVRKCVVEFLEKCKAENTNGQVIILAAGIDPLSVEIASLYPESIVFDVDKYSMREKEKRLHHLCPNIRFIECDLTNIELLKEKLSGNRWNNNVPTLLVMEGITYYLRETDLRNVLTFFGDVTSAFVCDFGMKSEYVLEENRLFGETICKRIESTIGWEEMKRYSPDYFMDLVSQCGFRNAERVKLGEIQLERVGVITPFEGDEPAWISMVTSLKEHVTSAFGQSYVKNEMVSG